MYGKISKLKKMKRYRVIYLPNTKGDTQVFVTAVPGQRKREKVDLFASNAEAARVKADKLGTVIDINEVTT